MTATRTTSTSNTHSFRTMATPNALKRVKSTSYHTTHTYLYQLATAIQCYVNTREHSFSFMSEVRQREAIHFFVPVTPVLPSGIINSFAKQNNSKVPVTHMPTPHMLYDQTILITVVWSNLIFLYFVRPASPLTMVHTYFVLIKYW